MRKNAKWFLKKTPKLVQEFVCPLFDLFYYCLQVFKNEKRSKHFLKLTFLLIFQIKSFSKFLSKWVRAKMNMEEKKLQTKPKSNTRKIQLQVNLCQSHSSFKPKVLYLTTLTYIDILQIYNSAACNSFQQILVVLALSQPRGTEYAHQIILAPRFSDLSKALNQASMVLLDFEKIIT